MEQALGDMEHAAAGNDVDRFYEHDRRFHLIHYGASGRPSLVEKIMGLRVSSERYARRAYVMQNVSMDDTVRTHRSILEAVRARDGAAAEAAIRADLDRTLATFCDWFA